MWFEFSAFIEPSSFNNKLHYAIKNFRNENKKLIQQIVRLVPIDPPFNYSFIYIILACAIVILLLMILSHNVYNYHKIEHEVGIKKSYNEYEILKQDEEFDDE